jgi:hypothetical protein
MIVHQLSVFIENKSGTLDQVLYILKKLNIQIITSTISDTVDFGIYRVLCSDPIRAYNEMKAAALPVNLTEVFAISLDNKVGSAADTIRLFSKASLNIRYLYSFLLNGKGILIFRTDDPEKAKEVIILNHIICIDEEDLALLN